MDSHFGSSLKSLVFVKSFLYWEAEVSEFSLPRALTAQVWPQDWCQPFQDSVLLRGCGVGWGKRVFLGHQTQRRLLPLPGWETSCGPCGSSTHRLTRSHTYMHSHTLTRDCSGCSLSLNPFQGREIGGVLFPAPHLASSHGAGSALQN